MLKYTKGDHYKNNGKEYTAHSEADVVHVYGKVTRFGSDRNRKSKKQTSSHTHHLESRIALIISKVIHIVLQVRARPILIVINVAHIRLNNLGRHPITGQISP